jgi:hypothetical protein
MSQLASNIQELISLVYPQTVLFFSFLGLSWVALLINKSIRAFVYYIEHGELPLTPEKLSIKNLQQSYAVLYEQLKIVQQERDEARAELKSSLSSLLEQISR